jgi:hypothetical protein
MNRSVAHRLHRAPTRVVTIALAAVALVGCATGPRPTLGAVVDRAKPIARQGTGDPLVDEVLVRLESIDTLTFTATYTVTPKPVAGETAEPFDVVVAQNQPLIRSITMGDTVFLRGANPATCSLAAKACDGGIDNTKATAPLTGTYFDDDVKAMLREAFTRHTKAAFTHSENIAEQDASCVTVPSGFDEDFCVLPSGQLAKVDTSDVMIVLTSIVDTADPARFSIPGP